MLGYALPSTTTTIIKRYLSDMLNRLKGKTEMSVVNSNSFFEAHVL
jgi:hypothetical protein